MPKPSPLLELLAGALERATVLDAPADLLQRLTSRLLPSGSVKDLLSGVFLLAIIGNAAEHSTAVLMAMKNKMDLSMNIAIGSSIQVALLVAPLLVFVSYAFGNPMDLVFTTFEIAAVALSPT